MSEKKLDKTMKNFLQITWENFCWFLEGWGFLLVMPVVGIIFWVVAIPLHVAWSMR